MKPENNDKELEQSVLRILLVSSFAVYALFVEYILTDHRGVALNAIIIGVGYSIISVALFLIVKRYPGYYVSRRLFGIVSDIGATSFSMLSLGEYGAPLFAAFTWITIGNGFRYGINYLVFCTLLSVAGFVLVALKSPFWAGMPTLLWAGLIVLTVVPTYVAVLLARLESQKVKAEIASREKSRFIANISHEIRTPLNAVVGFSNLLSKPCDADNQLRYIKGIRGSAKSLLALVDGVLEFSRIEAGHIDLEHRPLCLQELMMSISGMFSLQAESKGISFTCDIHPDVPQVIMGDENRLRQILINLAGNAIKFTEAGKVAITLAFDSSAQDGKTIQFAVSDTGIGIKEAVQPFIFERFRQADDTAQRHYGGTGLGTAIAKHLAELMGGRIGLDSEYGRGSRFWFTIPCELPAARQTALDDTCTNSPEPLLLHNGSRIRALVAEDSEINRHVFSGLLDFLGVDAMFAESGPLALQKHEDKKSDLVILDVQMPGMSGLDVIRYYHASTNVSERIPIMIVTGDATVEIQEECWQLGVRAFLTKPVELEKLHSAIAEIFRIDGKVTQAG